MFGLVKGPCRRWRRRRCRTSASSRTFVSGSVKLAPLNAARPGVADRDRVVDHRSGRGRGGVGGLGDDHRPGADGQCRRLRVALVVGVGDLDGERVAARRGRRAGQQARRGVQGQAGRQAARADRPHERGRAAGDRQRVAVGDADLAGRRRRERQRRRGRDRDVAACVSLWLLASMTLTVNG